MQTTDKGSPMPQIVYRKKIIMFLPYINVYKPFSLVSSNTPNSINKLLQQKNPKMCNAIT